MKNCINENDVTWQTIKLNSQEFELTMDSYLKKQTGSYYTSFDLTLQMMQQLVKGIDKKTRETLYEKKFFEPCVGTGNFVFSYLNICKSLNFSYEQNKTLLDNIFVCDINTNALQIYKQNMRIVALNWFNIELSDFYFESHIGNGLLFDLSSEKIKYIPLENVFSNSIIKDGFDIVVTNPPYKNLKAESGHYASKEEKKKYQEKYALIGEFASKYFPYSSYGTLNIYKLFVEEILERYLAPNGYASLLIPASILSDKSCTKLRTRLINTSSIKGLSIIPEKNNYIDASQALCATLFQKGKPSDIIYIDGSINGNSTKGTYVHIDDIIDKASDNAILVLSDNEYHIRKKMKLHPTIKDLGYIHNLRGELDVTFNSQFIGHIETKYQLLRGRHISHYNINSLPDKEYVDERFITTTAKKDYIFKKRLACQQIANMSKKRRVAFAIIPENYVLANSCNFISIDNNTDNIDIYYLMGILNSTLIDWYFKLTSSNNHINNYEIDNFPIPIEYGKKHKISDLVLKYLENNDENLLCEIDALVYEAYGISTENESTSDVGNKNSLFEHNAIINEFYKDIVNIIPEISFDECCAIIEHQANIRDISFHRKPEASLFEQKVLSNIELKYRKIYSGEILNHTTFKLSNLDLEMIKSVPQGGSWKDIPEETVKKSKRLERITRTGGRTTLYGRIDYSAPSYTITTYFNRPGNGTYVHPIHERVISVREAARFQSFPDNYMFCGNKTDMLNQVGNAVPSLLAYCIGKSIVEKTGCHTSVDLFSGAGGMTYGFKCAGISAAIANDLSESACITLKTNLPEIPVYFGDITDKDTKSVLISAGKNAKADIICGGPPCQGFSLAGYRMKDDPRNELFRHFVDIVSEVNPKIIVFENVEGLLSYQNGETYKNIIELFSELGYNTEGRKLQANHYAVPQKRKRVIILCTRKDLSVPPCDIFPETITQRDEEQIIAYDAISDLENVECSENAKYINTNESLYLKYLKGRISAENYFAEIMAREHHKVTERYEQISLFD